MQHLELSGAVRPLLLTLGVKRLRVIVHPRTDHEAQREG